MIFFRIGRNGFNLELTAFIAQRPTELTASPAFSYRVLVA